MLMSFVRIDYHDKVKSNYFVVDVVVNTSLQTTTQQIEFGTKITLYTPKPPTMIEN